MLNRIEQFLRVDSRMSAADIMRARAVYFTAMIVVLIQLLNQISMFFMLGGIYYVHVISMVACCIILTLGASLRWTKNFKALTAGFTGVLLLGVVMSALPVGRLGFADGINSSMLPLLICGTIMCAMMHNWRAPLYYCLPGIAIIWGFYALSSYYVRPDYIITPDIAMFQYVRAVQASLALVLAGLITSYFSHRMFGLFDELEANAETARRAEGLTSQYLADMSHEIRTPLNGIIGLSECLNEANIPEEEKTYVTIINESGEALLTVINDVLDLSKLDAGKLTLYSEPFDLHKLCANLTALHGMPARANGVALRLKYDENVPKDFIGDPGRLRQVLNNLLSNAVKFTDDGSIDLLVKGTAAAAGRYTLKIYVRDSGMGIPAAQLPHIFDRFEQVETANAVETAQRKRIKGSGLGLSIAKDMIKLMGGRIEAKSRIELGTVFGVLLELPLAYEEAVAPQEATGSADRAA